MDQLCHPAGLRALSVRLGRPLLRWDAPSNCGHPQPRHVLPADPATIQDFISEVGAVGSRAMSPTPPSHPKLIFCMGI